MNEPSSFIVRPIGWVRSVLKTREDAPRQGHEGAPDACLALDPAFVEGIEGVEPRMEIWILTWLHQSDRGILKVHPRGDAQNPLTGVFATRSPDRPNPIGLHRVLVLEKSGNCLWVKGLEAIDSTPILDIKPVIEPATSY